MPGDTLTPGLKSIQDPKLRNILFRALDSGSTVPHYLAYLILLSITSRPTNTTKEVCAICEEVIAWTQKILEELK